VILLCCDETKTALGRQHHAESCGVAGGASLFGPGVSQRAASGVREPPAPRFIRALAGPTSLETTWVSTPPDHQRSESPGRLQCAAALRSNPRLNLARTVGREAAVERPGSGRSGGAPARRRRRRTGRHLSGAGGGRRQRAVREHGQAHGQALPPQRSQNCAGLIRLSRLMLTAVDPAGPLAIATVSSARPPCRTTTSAAHVIDACSYKCCGPALGPASYPEPVFSVAARRPGHREGGVEPRPPSLRTGFAGGLSGRAHVAGWRAGPNHCTDIACGLWAASSPTPRFQRRLHLPVVAESSELSR
jgi:hypothetical protein